MNQISKRLAQVVKQELSKNIIPVKTDEGILVGSILIVSKGTLKCLYKGQELIYNEISLNKAAIKMANLMALHKNHPLVDKIYQADQEYGSWFADSQMLRNQYEKAAQNKQFDRADILWARYAESRQRTETAKRKVETLSAI
jgi:hypothetical protein